MQVGDIVVTAGNDGIYPKGFPIGRVETAERGTGLYKTIKVRPVVDFSNVEEVLVVLSPPSPAVADGRGQAAMKTAIVFGTIAVALALQTTLARFTVGSPATVDSCSWRWSTPRWRSGRSSACSRARSAGSRGRVVGADHRGQRAGQNARGFCERSRRLPAHRQRSGSPVHRISGRLPAAYPVFPGFTRCCPSWRPIRPPDAPGSGSDPGRGILAGVGNVVIGLLVFQAAEWLPGLPQRRRMRYRG